MEASVRSIDVKESPRPEDACLSGDKEQMGVLKGPQLGGLFTMLSSMFPFE